MIFHGYDFVLFADLYSFTRSTMWIIFSSSAILLAPVLFEVERAQMVEVQRSQQKQVRFSQFKQRLFDRIRLLIVPTPGHDIDNSVHGNL